jgi:hypothetical protein
MWKMRRLPAAAMGLLVLTACAGAQSAGEAAGPERAAASASASAAPATAHAAPSPSAAGTVATSADAPPTLSSEASTEPVATPGFPDGGGRTVALLAEVKAGRHPGFDRVVWTFDGDMPAYRVAYIERPITEDGSGDEIDIRGDAVLQIILTPASGTDLSGPEMRQVYDGPERIGGDDASTTTVAEVVQTGDFEATLSWAIGVGRRTPFAVSELSDPTRVVIDIAHE